MKISDYLKHPDVIVKLNGKPIEELGTMHDWDFGTAIVVKIFPGLLTVTSRNPSRPARIIRDTNPFKNFIRAEDAETQDHSYADRPVYRSNRGHWQ